MTSLKREAVSILSILTLGAYGGPAFCEAPAVVALVVRIDVLSHLEDATIAKIEVAGVQRIEVQRATSENMIKKGALVGGGIGLALDLAQLGIVWARGHSCGDDCGIPTSVLVVPGSPAWGSRRQPAAACGAA